MNDKEAIKDTLILIGNGFDLQHGYRTSYCNFVKHANSTIFAGFKDFIGSYLGRVSCWYDFEQVINDLTLKVFQDNLADCSIEDLERPQERLDKEIENITHELFVYLANETSADNGVRLPSVQEYIDESAVVVNFNYTSVAERYTKDIFYIHGSIKENNIILGYDNRDEPCLIDYMSMRRCKDNLRFALEFLRYMKKMHIDPECISKYQETLERFLISFHSSKGLEDEDYIDLPGGEMIKEFFTNHDLLSIGFGNNAPIKYDDIKRVVVMGHGIEADRVLLQEIIKRCINLKEAILFRHEKETDQKYSAREAFFMNYCPVKSQGWK